MLLGCSAAGKTALLYHIKLREVVNTLPTIGFNVESLDISSKRSAEVWDVGGKSANPILFSAIELMEFFKTGGDKIRPLTKHYMTGMDFLVYVVDVNDDERQVLVEKEIASLSKVMTEHGTSELWILFNKQDLIESEKRREHVEAKCDALRNVVSEHKEAGHNVHMFNLDGFSALNPNHVDQFWTSVQQRLRDPNLGRNKPREVEAPEPELRPLTQAELEACVKKELQDDRINLKLFWEQWLTSDIEVWDHYTYLKAGYFVLLDNLAAGRTVLGSSEEFLGQLARLQKANSEKVRYTDHKTMTIFWLAQLQQAILKAHWDRVTSAFPTRDDWPLVPTHNSQLMDTGLCFAYYSKSRLLSAEAQTKWCLPDKKQLMPYFPPTKHPQPEQTQPENTTDCLINFALEVTKQVMHSHARRGAILKQGFPALERSIIRKRNNGERVAPFSYTQAYFWLQFVHANLVAFKAHDEEKFNVAEWLSFSSFVELFKVTGQEWKGYYGAELWHSVEARIRFHPPDIRRLPDVLEVDMQTISTKVREIMVKEGSLNFAMAPQIPEQHDLEIMVAAALDEASWSDAVAEDEVAKSHGEYLHNIYEVFSDDGSTALAQRMEEATLLQSETAAGATARSFWVQQVSLKMASGETTNFEQFLNKNPQLAFRKLPLVHYSEMVWESNEAKDMFVPPDRMSLPSIVEE